MRDASRTAIHQVDRKRLLAFGLVMMLIMLIAAIFSSSLFLSLQKYEEDRLARTIGTILSESVYKISFSGKYHARILLEELQQKLPELAYISVETRAGIIDAHSDRTKNDTAISPDEKILSEQALATNSAILSEKVVAGTALKEVLLPFRSALSATPVGLVRIGIKVDEARATQQKILFLHIFMILILTLSAVWIMKILSGHLNKRLTATEHALRESYELFGLFLRHSPIYAFIKEVSPTTSRVLHASENFQEMVGIPGSAMVGKTMEDLFPADFATKITTDDWAVASQGAVLKIDEDLNDRHYTTIKFPIVQGGKTFLAGYTIDITDRKRAEKEKSRLEAQLLQAQKMESVGQLAGGVAHDFNNMLGVILGHAEMAMDGLDRSMPRYADLAEIHKAATRSADITRQLLAFARKQTIAPIVIDLNETIEGMLRMLRRLIGENIDLHWLPGLNLLPVKMDPSQIDQMLANLCVNARSAINGVGKITVATDNCTLAEGDLATFPDLVPGAYVRMTISDTGSGMDKETLAHIFEPFFTTKEVGQGTGLGLAMVYGAVRQNRGYIEVESTPQTGTTFTIYLPHHIVEASQITIMAEEATAFAPGGVETILLVEDEPAILNMTKTLLELLGYTVLPAESPAEAIRLFETYQEKIDLLATDMVMPEMNGHTLAKKLLAAKPHLKRLFISGFTADIIASQGILEEDLICLQKPFSRNELAAKVREALAK